MQSRSNDKNQSELDRLMTIATDVVEGQLRHFGYTIIVLTMVARGLHPLNDTLQLRNAIC